jgi:hypothetical protein
MAQKGGHGPSLGTHAGFPMDRSSFPPGDEPGPADCAHRPPLKSSVRPGCIGLWAIQVTGVHAQKHELACLRQGREAHKHLAQPGCIDLTVFQVVPTQNLSS